MHTILTTRCKRYRTVHITRGAQQARIQFSKGGGVRGKILKEKWLLIHISTRVHIKTRQTSNTFSLLSFQEDCLLFLLCLITYNTHFYFWNLNGELQPPYPPPQIRQCTEHNISIHNPCQKYLTFFPALFNALNKIIKYFLPTPVLDPRVIVDRDRYWNILVLG